MGNDSESEVAEVKPKPLYIITVTNFALKAFYAFYNIPTQVLGIGNHMISHDLGDEE